MKHFSFLFRKIRNYIFAMLAYNCPVNSWRIILHRWRGVAIGKNVTIGYHVVLDYSFPELIIIEDNASLSGENYILTHTIPKEHWKEVMSSFTSPVVIEEGAWLTIRSTVLPGVRVGKYSIIGAGSVVTKDVPPRTLVAGIPAKVIKYLKN